MPIGDPYASLAQLKAYLLPPGQQGTNSNDQIMTDVLASVSAEIEHACGRQFNLASTVSARVFEPSDWRLCKVDDFATTTGLVVQTDPGGTGNFTSTWSASDYELYPLNGVVDEQPGWPFRKIRSVGGLFFPKYTGVPYRRQATVQVTAQWGWSAVPAPVHEACLIMAATTFETKNTPFGVTGMSVFGAPVRVRDNPMAARKLAPYMPNPAMVG